jgi:hypothetical protein
MSRYADAVAEAKKLRATNTIPSAKFKDGERVVLDNHNSTPAVVLGSTFNNHVWMRSYTVSPENSDSILEIMEWGISSL